MTTTNQKARIQIVMQSTGCNATQARAALIENSWDTIDAVRTMEGKAATRSEQEDEKRGYADRLTGYYDKWYRYNRKDGGSAYDRGCVKAVNSGKCPDHFTLIEATADVTRCQI